ncbi:hypothetical protein M8C21_007523, partial [Ambrosia artemisiifolia]
IVFPTIPMYALSCCALSLSMNMPFEPNLLEGATSAMVHCKLKNNVPCNQRGQSYYNCNGRGQANPYTQGCNVITRCGGR